MKSVEEFEKSVFAKRDALLKKRKNRIITVASLACTALCLTVAASAIKPLKTASEPGGSGETEIYYDGALEHEESELGLFGEIFREDEEAYEKSTVVVNAEGVLEEVTTSYPKQFGYSPSGNTEIATEPEEETYILKYTLTVPYSKPKNPLAGETALAPEAGNLKDLTAGEAATYTYPDGYTEPYFAGGLPATEPDMPEKKYPSNEEIIAAALSCLTDTEKALIIDNTPSIAMVHYTDKTKGDEYEIFYRTLTGKIKIVLLVDTLELVEKK